MFSSRVVLVEPQVAGNVGACARVIANFGVTELVLVRPQCDWFSQVSRERAVAVSEEVLKSARVVHTLTDAISDCVVSAGFTRRHGERRNPMPLRQFVGDPLLKAGKVALVFGNEEAGLSHADLELCTHPVIIETAPALPSMNLSHAVAVVAARIFEAQVPISLPPEDRSRLATHEEVEGLLNHWRSALIQVGIGDAGNPDRVVGRIRKIFHRTSLRAREAALLRAFLSRTQNKIDAFSRDSRTEFTHSN